MIMTVLVPQIPLTTTPTIQAIQEPPTTEVVESIDKILEPLPTWDEAMTPYFRSLAEKRSKRKNDCKARGGELVGERCEIPEPSLPPIQTAYIAPKQTTNGLVGSLGYALPGNCVNEIPFSIRPPGSPFQWVATTQAPYIGAVALFNWNHTGRVVGIWGNGDLEIAHQGWWGPPQTRFSRSIFRGFR